MKMLNDTVSSTKVQEQNSFYHLCVYEQLECYVLCTCVYVCMYSGLFVFFVFSLTSDNKLRKSPEFLRMRL